jgi:hypothetical protein
MSMPRFGDDFICVDEVIFISLLGENGWRVATENQCTQTP